MSSTNSSETGWANVTPRSDCKVRIHAIVLTRNRPETLQRCIAFATASMSDQDAITVVDDSCPAGFLANAAVLNSASGSLRSRRGHIPAPRAADVLAREIPATGLSWLSKVGPRDIAPLRNLSLLASSAFPSETTILIDDDISCFDLEKTHRGLRDCRTASGGVIAGCHITGINEEDTITRLEAAIDRLEDLPGDARIDNVRELFRVATTHDVFDRPGFVSGGYLAFDLSPERLCAFPPGYNEDWLWCLLQGGDSDVRILRQGTVKHDPPDLRRPERQDVLFELVGDVVFDCLEAQQRVSRLPAKNALAALASASPASASMPSTRASEFLERAATSTRKGYPIDQLREFGISVLQDLLNDGELAMDGNVLIRNWCHDALEKQASLAAVRGARANRIFTDLMREGTF